MYESLVNAINIQCSVVDFSRLWNGIFNFIWMSDKLLVQVSYLRAFSSMSKIYFTHIIFFSIQEEDVESISKLIHVLKKHEMLFVSEFFKSLASQWDRG